METEKNECFPEELNKLKFAFESARGKGLSADKLKIEQNFIEYINMLKSFAKRYTVFITSADTPCGPMFSTEIAAELMKIGLKINLSGKNRRSYAAIIDTGELIYEKLSDSVVEPVEYECSIGDSSIMLESIGFKVPKNNNARIIIDGKNYSLCGRGLNFVVFDMVTKSLIDAVNFDTYSDNFPCLRSHVIIDGLLDYQKAHPEVSVLCFTFPMFPDSNLNDNEKYLLQNGVGRLAIMANPSNPNFVLNKYFSSSEEIIEVLTAPKSYIDINGVRRFEDVRGKCVNISGGHRVTIGQPKDYKRTIYIVGGCQTFGVGSSDKGTIASHLQRLFNELTPEQEVIVQNYGFYLSELSNSQRGEELTILKSLPVQYGDIILCDFGANSKIPCVNLAAAAKHPHNYGEVFYDTAHRTEDGNRMIADKLFERIKQENFFSGMQAEPLSNTVRAPKAGDGYFGLDSIAKKELKEYKNTLIELYNSMFNITVGAIVMNCNPFTLGHRYLIEYASAQVDHLIIFAVQEDKSIFPFDDRLKLIIKGIADLKNVTVIPSGKFVISSLTFSEYFNKSEIQDRIVDSSLDVTLFAQEIAPCLNIRMRFVGEEPFDNVTKQYNNTLRAILPQYGIRFVEIPRKEFNNKPISASWVRKLLEEKDFDAIAEIVPKTTLEYLREHF